jgi:hypothetical protein
MNLMMASLPCSRKVGTKSLYPSKRSMLSNLEIHSLPDLQRRSPTSSGPLLDLDEISDFISDVVRPSGVGVPTVLVLNLEGRFPSAAALFELLVPLGRAIASGTHGELALVLATPDPALGSVIRAIADRYGLGMFLAPSADSLDQAEPIGPLSPSDLETLAILRNLGGRASVSTFAQAANLDHKAAGNRLASLDQRQYVLRVDRPRPQGHMYLDPRVASAAEEPMDPTSPEFGLPPDLRSDVRALAEMQGREPSAVLADAWQEFLRKHADDLSREHRKAADMMKAGDKKGIADYTARHAARRSRSQAPRKQT